MLTSNKQTLLVVAAVAAVAGLTLVTTRTELTHARRTLSPYCSGTAPIHRVLVEATKDKFVPAKIDVVQGECVELLIRATGGTAHTAAIEGTAISSEGAPLFDQGDRRIGRAVARENSYHTPALLKEGWFAPGEQVLLRFQANEAGDYRVRCDVAESLGNRQAQPMLTTVSVSRASSL